MIRIIESSQVGTLLARKQSRFEKAEQIVKPILDDVRKRGDKALLEYARKFDSFDRKSPLVPKAELDAARATLSPEFRSAVSTAAANVAAFAKLQLPAENVQNLAPGHKVGQLVRPLDTVAAYIPAGRYPYPSTVIMTAVPARAAGVPDVCVTTPRASTEILGVCSMLEVNRVFLLGGAHAIAAFAYGTKTVPRADRIVGPGNIYVAAAKKLLAGEVGIDFIAGPTEILIIAAEGNPAWIAADMLAQAEHDTDASAILLTTSKRLAAGVAREIEQQLKSLSTAAVARKAIDRNSAIVVVRKLDEAVTLCNLFAPEHLSIPDESLLPGIRNAGSIFIGAMSPEAAGDSASGPN
ncbi:MAG TPA: histidinol dehydrogenase, partial [Bryobacteraceae bacterium]|nr:histidinol dehydrogenase [Bryobacteraceae bacterium]